MPVKAFPDPRTADEDGLLAIGGDLSPETLVLAYGQGIFPWPIEGMPLPWFCPPERAVLDFHDLHIPRSLHRSWNKRPYQMTLNRSFQSVIKNCAAMRYKATWITPKIEKAYLRLHELGLAQSVEAWSDDRLVGGLYGVSVGGTFAGESMFHVEDDASKHAILHLVEHLKTRGLDWIDIQQLTPHMERLGAKLIPRDDYLARLKRTQALKLRLFE